MTRKTRLQYRALLSLDNQRQDDQNLAVKERISISERNSFIKYIKTFHFSHAFESDVMPGLRMLSHFLILT
jgi:hypothetical protein